MFTTKLQKILKENRWLITKISNELNIHKNTMTKASKWGNILYDTKFDIYSFLIKKELINPKNIKLPDLFTKIETKWKTK